MAEKDKTEKRINKNVKTQPNALRKIGAFLGKTGKRLRSFFLNLKAELKRVVWPDKKRLIQSTATVLVICLLTGIILFVVDTVVGGLLNLVGFYTPSKTPAATTTISTTVSDTSTTAAGQTTSSGTTAASSTTATTAAK
jgi:preprotein translocase subunit SecE